MTPVAPHLAAFLREYLPRDRGCSSHTCDSYAYAFQLLVCFAADRYSILPSLLSLEHFDAPLVTSFLEHLEVDRNNSVSTRNARLAAIKSFAHFIEYRLPSAIDQIHQRLAIPEKKTLEPLVYYLDSKELQALLNAPDPRNRRGIRDLAMLHLAFSAGLRVSELIGLKLTDLQLHPDPCIRIRGKGRRERLLPLWKETTNALRKWIGVRAHIDVPELFVNAKGRPISRSGFQYILSKHVQKASESCESLSRKNVSPHVLRHTCAIHILQATHDVRKVSLWLGHASMQSTEVYLRVDPSEKLAALNAGMAPALKKGRFTAPDKLLEMLKAKQGAQL